MSEKNKSIKKLRYPIIMQEYTNPLFKKKALAFYDIERTDL